MHVKRSQEEAHLILSRREALRTAGITATAIALGACASEEPVEETTEEVVEEATDAAASGATIDDVVAKLDKDYVYNLTEELSHITNDDSELGFRNAGSTGEKKCRDRIIQEMEAIGLEITVDPFPVDAWEFKYVTLEAGGETFQLSALAGSPGTDGPITTEIVDCGDGSLIDLEGKDLEGKIVLAHFDVLNYWFTAPAYQAELAGAKAIVVDTIGGYVNAGEDSLFSVDVGSRDAIPVLTISKVDNAKLTGMMTDGKIECTLDANVTLDHEGESANILGMIPGRDGTDQNILFGAHYDGYFNAWMDDVYGVSMMLNIAKAMKEVGYQPEHNIIFVAYGSEEYGVSNRYFDFCTGVWNQISANRPDWVGKTLCHLEIDGVRPDANTYILNATPEYHSWFKDKLEGLTPPAEPYVNGAVLKNQGGPWCQDYEMEINGVPGLCAGKTSDSEWYNYCYHTTASCAERDYNENVTTWLAEQYTRMALEMDSCTIAPLDFSTVSDQCDEGFDETLAPNADNAAAYKAAVAQMRELSGAHYALLTEANEAVMQARAAGTDIADVFAALLADNKDLLDAYKLIQHDKFKLDVWSTVAYKFDVRQANIGGLVAAIDALKAGDGAAAIDSLFWVDSTYLASCFSKDVYEFSAIEMMDPNRDDLYWASGKVPEQLNTYDAYHAISDKVAAGATDFADEVAMLEDLLAQENELFDQDIQEDTEILNQVNEILTASPLADNLELLKAKLQ